MQKFSPDKCSLWLLFMFFSVFWALSPALRFQFKKQHEVRRETDLPLLTMFTCMKSTDFFSRLVTESGMFSFLHLLI